MKKQILFLLIIFFLANANAYETNVQISTIDETIPVTGTGNGFYHWVTLDWEYTGPTGGYEWETCDFESVDKNYGIFLDLSGEGFSDNALTEEFGPVTSTPICNNEGSITKCTARTTYFFKLETFNYSEDTNLTVPIKIRGKCGTDGTEPEPIPYIPTHHTTGYGKYGPLYIPNVTKEKEGINSKILFDEETLYSVDMDYTYVFTVNGAFESIVPEIDVTTRWGKQAGWSSPAKDALLEVSANDPLGKNIVGFSWVYPANCDFELLTSEGEGTTSMEESASFNCETTGFKLLIAYVTNEDNLVGYQAFLSYISSNENEVELDFGKDVLIALPNQYSWFEYNEILQHFDYRVSMLDPKVYTIIKDTGNGLTEIPETTIETSASTPFNSIPNPVCPLMTITGLGIYEGENFKIGNQTLNPRCQVGNHKITITSIGNYSDSTPFVLTKDFNFVVLDILIDVLNMQTTEERSNTYGMVFGENGVIDLNISINNYSPKYTDITNADFYYNENLSGGGWIVPLDTCTSEQINVFAESETLWKINAHLECTDSHLFYPTISLSDFPDFIPLGMTTFWVSDPTDKLKMDSLTLENLYDYIWNEGTQTWCNPKPGYSDSCGALQEGETGLVALPETTTTVTKGDLLRFYALITNVYADALNAKVILTITDSQGNEVAVLEQTKKQASQTPIIPPGTVSDFNILYYDTDYLSTGLYTVTGTVYWLPENGFEELDKKPLNNTKVIYFYVEGESFLTNLPETNYLTIIITLVFVSLILLKK